MDLQQANEILQSIKFGPPITNIFTYQAHIRAAPRNDRYQEPYFYVQVWLNDRISNPVLIAAKQVTKEYLYTTVLVCCQQIISSMMYESYFVPNLSVRLDPTKNR